MSGREEAGLVLMRRIPSLILGVYAVYMVFTTAIGTMSVLRRFFPDDGFFYMVIARNVALGYGSTFDRVDPTNGYQPLWLVVLAVAYRLIGPLSPDAGQRLTLLLGVAGVLAGGVLFLRILQRVSCPPRFQPLAVAVYLGASAFHSFGMEAHLGIALALWLILSVWDDWPAPERASLPLSRAAILGIAGALVVLCRLDNALFVGAVLGVLLAAWALRYAGGASTKRLVVTVTLPLAALVGGYLIFNRVVFAHWTTISASLKVGRFMMRDVFWQQSIFFRTQVGLTFVVAVVALALNVRAVRHRGFHSIAASPRLTLAAALAGSAAVTCLLYVFMLVPGLAHWHLALPSCLCLVSVVLLIAEAYRQGVIPHSVMSFFENLAIAGAVTAVAVLIAVGARKVIGGAPPDFPDPVEFRRQLATRLQPGDVVYQAHGGGEMAWFCECRLFGDGLVGSWAYQNAIKTRRVREFLDERRVRYVIEFDPLEREGRRWIEAEDWGDDVTRTVPIVGYDETDVVLRVGDYFLFAYPGHGVSP